jgi:hypothetical protein
MSIKMLSKKDLSKIIAALKLLVGADINKPSRTFGTTPLQIAFKKNDFKTAYLLYRYGANLYYINKPYKYHGIEKQIYDVKYYAQTNKAKKLFSLLEELEKNKTCAILASLDATLAHEEKINKVKSDIEKLCV